LPPGMGKRIDVLELIYSWGCRVAVSWAVISVEVFSYFYFHGTIHFRKAFRQIRRGPRSKFSCCASRSIF
jgi:hypothetical protein